MPLICPAVWFAPGASFFMGESDLLQLTIKQQQRQRTINGLGVNWKSFDRIILFFVDEIMFE